jgi:hypothetical protein
MNGNLLMGSAALIVNLGIQVMAVVLLIRFFVHQLESGEMTGSLRTDLRMLSTVILVLFFGHLLQAATWSLIFLWLNEFSDVQTAFYHSLVNLTSLGYGDIVMSEKHRLLGAMEAANGVLMFGLSAGSILSVMNRMFSRHAQVVAGKDETAGR